MDKCLASPSKRNYFWCIKNVFADNKEQKIERLEYFELTL